MTEINVFADALARLERIGTEAGIRPEVIAALKQPKATLTAALPVRMDDGTTRYFVAHRCRYNDALGPTKGGIRYHPNVALEEVQALALWMAMKCALLGLPYGGAKGGVVVDPKSLSHLELERLSRAYVRAMAGVIGPDRDIPAPDVYTNERIMGWMVDEYQAITRVHAPAVITGKPVCAGGIPGRDEATGRGAFIAIQELVTGNGLDPQALRVAIQGFGNAGYHTARLLQSAGYRIVALSDSKGAIYSEAGFDVESVHQAKQATRQVRGVYCEGSVCHQVTHQRLTNEELLALDVDLLIPAALEGVLRPDNVAAVRARYVIEVANGPIVGAADAQLHDRGITVVPDILANAGGVTVSYFEWVQNHQGYAWPLETVRRQLEEFMTRAFREVRDLATAQRWPLRTAAYALALRRIAAAIEAQGTREYFAQPE